MMEVIRGSVAPKQDTSNIIELKVIEGKISKKEKVRYNKDGSIDKRHTNRVKGVSSEVYPFITEDEIKKMIDVFNTRIENTSGVKKQIACRNKMLFLVGINIGIRASDLCVLKWEFFLKEDGKFKDFYSLQPKKTRKTGKFVKLYFNDTVKKAITDYINEYPIKDMNDFVFKSRQGNKSITEAMLWKIVSDAAIEAKLDLNYGSHSLRKTFGYWVWHNAEDKNKALVVLQMIFNHSDTRSTMKYIGLLNDEISDVFNGLDLGLEFL